MAGSGGLGVTDNSRLFAGAIVAAVGATSQLEKTQHAWLSALLPRAIASVWT